MAGDHTIEWYGPDRGKGSVEDIVSHLPGVKRAVQDEAQDMGRQADMALLAHHRTGAAHVVVGQHPGRPADSPDWYVSLEDPDPGGEGYNGKWKHRRSALSIEKGWTTKGGKRVDGLNILGGVMQRAARRYGGRR